MHIQRTDMMGANKGPKTVILHRISQIVRQSSRGLATHGHEPREGAASRDGVIVDVGELARHDRDGGAGRRAREESEGQQRGPVRRQGAAHREQDERGEGDQGQLFSSEVLA